MQLILRDSWNYAPHILVPSSAKRIATQISVVANLHGREDLILRGNVYDMIPAKNHLLKVSNSSVIMQKGES